MPESNTAAHSKEAIASRMFRQAARYWGLNDTNMDNFDPLVRLLIEACAVEVYRIGNEIATVQERMTGKLAGLLTPEVYVQAWPANAVVHGRSTEPSGQLRPGMQFMFPKKIASRTNGPLDASVEVFFAPTGRFKAVDGDVRMIAMGHNVYSVNEWQQKETFLKTSAGRSFPARTAWVGIEVPQPEDLMEVPFFFDLKNTPGKERILSLMQYAHCTVNGQEVKFERGLPFTEGSEYHSGFHDTLEVLYINQRMARSVNDSFRHHFLTLSPENEFLQAPGQLRPYPPEFEQYLGPKELAMLRQDLLWFKFTLTPEFQPEVLDDLMVSINCFPVVNRRMNELTYRLNNFFNIIPLLSSEQFFSIQSVEGTVAGGGRTAYAFYPFDHFDPTGKGSYTLRSGDLERFDSRNAAEYLNYLIELLRDESRAFAAFGQDFIATTIKELSQNINLIEQKLQQNKVLLEHAPTYLLINPIEEGDTIFVRFWTCNGALGNGIRSGSRLELYEGTELRGDSIVLMTTTTGGRDRLKNTEVLSAYRSALLSRDRIVTEQDIKSFCAWFLQDKAEAVEIRRGVAVSSRPNEGLVPVVNVIVTAADREELDEEEWDGIRRELLSELERQSVVEVNYRLVVV